MLKIIFSYLNFLFHSTNQHGVHSPFIFNLVTKCFYKKNNYGNWELFLKIKRDILNDKRIITVKDFGAGSRVFKTNSRKVADIAKIAGISNKKARFILKLIHYFKPKAILEVGTSIGLSTSSFAIANPKAKIISLEGCDETAKIAKEYFKKNNFKNIKVTVGDFKNTLQKTVYKQYFDCIYFDGNHTKEATLKYFQDCLSSKNNNSFWIFDDIYWNKEMKEAWQIIKNHPEVTVTVDVFYFGIVFFRKEQAKEHFKIRV
jgi:predicted O-methyltransferase YrrM